MKNEESVQQVFDANDHVAGYEQKAKQANWVGPEVVFGLSYGHIQPQETILDIGIGTGLSSVLYHKAGLQVYGIDHSQKMLDVCAEKQIAVALKQHDLRHVPYPYDDCSIHHAVSAGVFHIFSDLTPIFTEVARILKPKGIFVFSVMDHHDGEKREVTVQSDQFPGKTFTLYRYNVNEIDDLLTSHGFVRLKVLEFVTIHVQKKTNFKAYLSQKH